MPRSGLGEARKTGPVHCKAGWPQRFIPYCPRPSGTLVARQRREPPRQTQPPTLIMPPYPTRNPASMLTRRDWLRGGGALAGSLLWPGLLRAQQERAESAPAKRVILIYLQGGLSHYESFDPKPDAISAYRGDFGHIPTTIPGIHFSEHLPLLAKRAHKFNVIRSAYVNSPSHPVAIYQTLTGWDLPGASVESKNRNVLHPSIGSVIARCSSHKNPLIPPYVTVPHSGQLGRRVHYGTAGPLGAKFEPLDSGIPPEAASDPFTGPPDLSVQQDLSIRRVQERLNLLQVVEGNSGVREVEALDGYYRQAAELLSGGAASRAFDLALEPTRQRERYGNHLWGQQTILARRLAEAGVPFTLVNYTLNQDHGQDWDTHKDNFNLMKNVLLPPMDLAVSALLDDLEERGLLDTTLVAMYGEFGRTPKINADAGRDHWDKVFSVFLAGGGLKSGVVVGESTRNGDVPLERPVPFNDVLATIYHQMGVRTDEMFYDQQGRPSPLLSSGVPIHELI